MSLLKNLARQFSTCKLKITIILESYLQMNLHSRNLAFIGAVGVPNNYGGFEMFLESCAPQIALSLNQVYITCDKTKYVDKSSDWKNIKRIFLPIKANGASSVLHDLVAFLRVFLKVDVIIVLGVSGGIFFPLFRLLCSLFGKTLIVNVDGVEWRRDKFSKGKKLFLFVSDRLAQLFSHHVVVDNEALRPFLIKYVRNTAHYIPYPGDHVERLPSAVANKLDELNCLTICRIEPENNCHILLEAFASVGKGSYIFVGNWDASEYGRQLREKYSHVKGLEMRDPVYEKSALVFLRDNCTLYLHGHNVGGTNPSLVEMLFYDSTIIAYDCTFNRCTADTAIGYFKDLNDLVCLIQKTKRNTITDRSEVRSRYTREHVAQAYIALIP